jgi:hypothetical protein
MSASENIFKGDRALIATVDVDGPLSKAEVPCCEYYMSAYAPAAQQAQESGNINSAHVYRFLQAITSFCTSFDTPAQPFVPFMQMHGSRGLIPSDFTTEDIEAVRELSKVTKDPTLRSRLFDVLWELTNDYKLCGEAARSYIEAAERLNAPEQWTYSGEHYHRGMYLAAKLGRNKELFKNAAESLQQAARNSASDTEQFRCCRFLELLIRFNCGDPVEFAAIAAGHAQRNAESGNLYATQHYREVEADLYRLAKDAVAEKTARLAAAEASVVEAENRAKGPGASLMAAAALLSKAIEALRQAGAAKERIDELRQRLNEWQQGSLAEFQTFSTGVDISKMIVGAQNHVKGVTFQEAILKLAFGQDLSDPKGIKDEVLNAAKNAPLTYLMGATIVDSQGRTTARKESLFNLTGEALEEALEAESFSHASHFHWPLRVDGFIEPARVQILNEHKPTFEDLFSVTHNNPFIPPGHEWIFLRGIHAGFHGDFIVATHLLTPQIENSLRYVLESHSADISNLMSDGTQPVKVLGAIFGMTETKEIFGDELCFELRGCLIEKTGFDFRNRVAHGFVHDAECYSHAGVTVWWLVLRICLMPIFQTIAERKDREVPSAATTNKPE